MSVKTPFNVSVLVDFSCTKAKQRKECSRPAARSAKNRERLEGCGEEVFREEEAARGVAEGKTA
jgi:hypothetical protein